MGIPVWSECEGEGTEHWTLLVLRRSGDQMEHRYYDSADNMSPTNLSSADLVYQLICREMKMEPQPLMRCKSSGCEGGRRTAVALTPAAHEYFYNMYGEPSYQSDIANCKLFLHYL